MAGDHDKFAVLILTHGRPDNQRTVRALAKCGYTGPVYFVIDNEDDTAEEYRQRFGADRVIQFDKAAVAATFDTADLSEDRRTIVYARNASQQIARDLGLDYFLQLDDDYNYFAHRFVSEVPGPQGGLLRYAYFKNLDQVCRIMLRFLDDTDALTVAFSQGGDHIGGDTEFVRKWGKRKAMNSFFIRTDRPVRFVGRVNEDVNTYVLEGSRGELFLTPNRAFLVQPATQSQGGGMTDSYLDGGTYTKSFYTVMMNPSSVQVRMMGTSERRFHHQVRWDNAVPKILAPQHRKPRGEHDGERRVPAESS